MGRLTRKHKNLQRFVLLSMCVVLTICFIGCGKKEPVTSVGERNTLNPTVSPEELNEVILYLPDENVEYLRQKAVAIVKSPQGLVEALEKEQAVPKGTKVNFFLLQDNGAYIDLEDDVANMSDKLIGELDLSDEFLEEVTHTGTAGESMLLGSVVNTFIHTYHLQKLKLTADEQIIETGHAIYDEPFEFMHEMVQE